MSKKDYERAATIAQAMSTHRDEHVFAVEAFLRFFRADGNPRFDEARFLQACVPGANVRARPRKVA
jgi:hypothetical protein